MRPILVFVFMLSFGIIDAQPFPGGILAKSTSDITGVILMESRPFENLPYMREWKDSMSKKQFLVILTCYDHSHIDTSGFARRNIKVYLDGDCSNAHHPMPHPQTHLMNPHLLSGHELNKNVNAPDVHGPVIMQPHHQAALPAGHQTHQLTQPPAHSGGASIFHGKFVWPIGTHVLSFDHAGDIVISQTRMNVAGKLIRTVFIANIAETPELTKDIRDLFNVDTVIYAGDLHILEGGNHFMLGNHLLVGNTFMNGLPRKNRAQADSIIRSTYHLQDKTKLTIDFLGTADTSSPFYHLDLAMTYTGPDSWGHYKFFVSDIPAQSAAASIDAQNVKASLDTFATTLKRLLDFYFPGLCTIIRVPVYVGTYVVSPVNGVVDNNGGNAQYYFPRVDTARSGMPAESMRKLVSIQDSALHIFEAQLGPGNVIPMRVPFDIVYLGSQSLHCTMGLVHTTN